MKICGEMAYHRRWRRIIGAQLAHRNHNEK
jgi:hypothetical protein